MRVVRPLRCVCIQTDGIYISGFPLVLLSTELNNVRCVCFWCLLAVFVFFCPDEAKVRSKMLMATCKSAVIAQAFEKFGIKFDRQVAFDDSSLISGTRIPRSRCADPIVATFGRWKYANFRRSRATLKP